MKVGCYTLDLYCDNINTVHAYKAFPQQFTGRTEASCIREAKRLGWSFGRVHILCPSCAEARKRGKAK